MRGISARSLDQTVAKAVALAGDVDGLGDELFEIVSVLDSSPALRRMLSDPAQSDQSRTKLVNGLIADRVSQEASAVTDVAVTAKWSSTRDLADSLELAGANAVARHNGHVDQLEDELFWLSGTIRAYASLRASLSDRRIEYDAKANLIDRLFANKVSAGALKLTQQAARARTGSFEKVLATFAESVAERHGRKLADVRIAHRLADEDRNRLAEVLSSQFGSDLHLNITVDPDVIGGMSVSIGSRVFDGTISSRLASARRLLAG